MYRLEMLAYGSKGIYVITGELLYNIIIPCSLILFYNVFSLPFFGLSDVYSCFTASFENIL